jgi:NADPH:quinone reductase-like Zn-dependent oxidoreductase
MDLSGKIESVGKNVKNFKVGDKIIAGTGLGLGAYAEYKCVKESGFLSRMPSNISFEEASTIPTGGTNALHYIRQANLQPGQKILIIGAGGCFGTYAVQLAKIFGAEVTAVDSTDKLNVLREIGADHVVDFTQDDFTENGELYDVIFDIAAKNSVTHNMHSLREDGKYILSTPWVKQVLQGIWSSMISSKKFIFALANERTEDLSHLTGLIEAGKLKPVIDSIYPLEKTADAHHHVESGKKIGHVVISINNLL